MRVPALKYWCHDAVRDACYCGASTFANRSFVANITRGSKWNTSSILVGLAPSPRRNNASRLLEILCNGSPVIDSASIDGNVDKFGSGEFLTGFPAARAHKNMIFTIRDAENF